VVLLKLSLKEESHENNKDVSIVQITPRGGPRGASPPGAAPIKPTYEEHFISDPANSRKTIRDLTRGRVGAYVWTNKFNGNQYVGSSLTLINRITSYFIVSIVGSGTRYILRALNLYGMINFSLHIYLLPEGSDKDSVLALEQYLIDTLDPK